MRLPPLPAQIRIKSTGSIEDVLEHTLDGGVLVGDYMNPQFVKYGDYDVVVWDKGERL